MFCNYCGAPNPDDASFCSTCGRASARSSANVAPREEVAQKLAPTSSQGAAPVAAKERDSQVSASAERVRTFSTGHTLHIRSLAFSLDGRWLASGSSDKTAKLWDVRDGREVRTFTGRLMFNCVEFSPDGRRLVLAGCDEKLISNAIMLWDSATPNELRNFVGHQGQVFFVKFSPDGRWLASTDGRALINLWDVTSGRIIKVFKHGRISSKLLSGTGGSSLAFSPDGRFLATRASPATLWDLSSGKEVRTFGPEPFSDAVSMFLGFTPDGRSLVQARGDGSIKIWDVPSGKEARCLADPPEKSGVTFGVYCAALSPDGSLLAVSSWSSAAETSEIALWDIPAGRIRGRVTVSDCPALAFSPDGQWLAAGEGEHATVKIRLWMISALKDFLLE